MTKLVLVAVAVLPVSEDDEALVDALVRDARRGRKSKPLGRDCAVQPRAPAVTPRPAARSQGTT